MRLFVLLFSFLEFAAHGWRAPPLQAISFDRAFHPLGNNPQSSQIHAKRKRKSFKSLMTSLLSAHSFALPQRHIRSRRVSMLSSAQASDSSPEDETAPIPSSGDVLVSGISKDGSISVKAVVTTDLVGEASRYQGLSGLAAAAVGRTMTCSILLCDGMESDEVLQFQFRGDGPLGQCFATCNGALESRGFVQNPKVELPPNSIGKLDVGRGIGKGVLSAVRMKKLPGEVTPKPYESVVQIVSGEIPEDINNYLYESEQRQGALAAGVFVQGVDNGKDLNGVTSDGARVTDAGGWYVNLLPFAAEETIKVLEANLQEMASKPLTSLIHNGVRPEEMINMLLKGLEPQILSHRLIPSLAESCPCSEERVFRSLALLPRSEIDDILKEEGKIEVICEFCKTRYEMDENAVRTKLDKAEPMA